MILGFGHVVGAAHAPFQRYVSGSDATLASKMPTTLPGGSGGELDRRDFKRERTGRRLVEEGGAEKDKDSAHPHGSHITWMTLPWL